MAPPLSAGLMTVLGNELSWCMALVCEGARFCVMCFEGEKLDLRECKIVEMYLRRLELEGVGGCQVPGGCQVLGSLNGCRAWFWCLRMVG